MKKDDLRFHRNLRESRRYSNWLCKRAEMMKRFVKPFGWNLSRKILRTLGKPDGATSWPYGLTLLLLNAKTIHENVNTIHAICADLKKLMNKDGLPYNANISIDQGGLAYASARLYEIGAGQNYLTYSQVITESVAKMPGADNGLIPYTLGNKHILIDTLAFICPALARTGRIIDDRALTDVALRQINTFYKYGWDSPNAEFPYHGFDSETKKPLGIPGWGRGVAWLLLALVDTALELVGDDREVLLDRAFELLDRLNIIQLPSGHWPWNFNDINSHPDSSVTAIVHYCATRLRTNIRQNKTLMDILEKTSIALEQSTLPNGFIDSASGEAEGFGSYSNNFGGFIWALGPAVAADSIAKSARAA